jgi:hypothetical protein
MTSPWKILPLLAVLILAMAGGCARQGVRSPDELPLDREFKPAAGNLSEGPVLTPPSLPDTPAALDRQVGALRAEIRDQNYAAAAARLRQLTLGTNLTAAQLGALHETMVLVQTRLAEKAAAGDPAAKRAWEEFQRSLTR